MNGHEDDKHDNDSGNSGPGGGGNPGHGGGSGNHRIHIKIDRNEFEVEAATLTGEQLRHLPQPPIGLERDLFEIVPGGTDLKIEVGTKVELHDGMRFFTAPAQINPG